MDSFEKFSSKGLFLPNISSIYLSQCLERGGKKLADKEIGFAKNAVKQK